MVELIKKTKKQANNFLLALSAGKNDFLVIIRYLICHPKKFYGALSDRARKWTLRGLVVFLIVLLAIPVSIWYGSKRTEAAWWNDFWQYRKSIAVTNNTTAESNVYISLTLDTSDTTKFQADCGDLRFTNLSGDLMQYYIASGCGTASTVVHTLFDVFPAGAQTIYYYYGNPSAVDGFSASDFTTAASNYTVGSLGSEEKSTGPIAYWSFDEGQGMVANNSVSPTVIATGGTITEVGGYRIHTFTSSGTFSVSDGGNVEVLVVAGGGGGGSSAAGSGGGGGGGAGGLVYNSSYTVDAGDVTVTVGNGGAPGTAGANQSGSNGEDSAFGSITTIGGGGGGRTGVNGNSGGSGGGGGYNGYSVVRYGGSGTSGQGNAGGNTSLLSWAGGAGGGGAGGVGGDNKINHAGGDRGPGLAYSISGSSVTYATGGSGGSNTPAASPANVGKGGDAAYAAGTPYAGGSGVVIVRYPISYGTLTNMSSTASPTSGWQTEDKCVSGKCLAFDRTDDYVSVPDNSNLASSNITVSAWVKTPTVSTEQMIASKYYNQTTLKGWALEIYQSKITFTINGNVNKQANTALSSNTWYYVVATYDGSAINLYVNGVLDGSLNTASGITNPAGSLYVGAYTYNSSYKFKGLIDEPKIYNYARSAAQIKMDYNVGLAGTGGAEGASVSFGGKSQKWMTDGLVGHWKMDEASWNGTAGEVVDASGNANNGTAAGGATTGTGKFGNGGGFDGTDDYVSISNNIADLSGDWSVSLWLKPSDDSNPRVFTLITDVDNLELGYAATTLYPYIRIDGSTQQASSGLSSGVWQHVVYQVRAGTREIYVNGTALSLSNGGITANGMYSAIGGGYDNYQYNGLIDDARIYNRALSPEEISGLYNYAPGPIGYWKMDENTGTTVNDVSGNNYGLSFGNTPTWTQGKFGAALNFDNDDYVSLDWTDFSLINQTIEFWIKADTVSTGWRDLLGTTLNTDYNRFHLDSDNNSIRWYNYIGSASSLDSNVVPVAGQWYHVTGTYDGTTIKIYVNGQLKNSVAANISSYTTTGLWVGGTTEDFDGQIDEVKIYNYARTPAQIMADYGTGQAQKQPIGYWKFDEGYGATANSSGVGDSTLNGTIVGATWSNNGKFRKALNFDGVDDIVDTTFNLPIDKDFTLSAWVNKTSDTTRNTIIGSWSPWIWHVFDKQVQFETYIGSVESHVSANTNVEYNEWTYLSVKYIYSQDKIIFYRNGVFDGESTLSGKLDASAGVVHIGGYPSWKFHGLIDEVKIYNYALTADEIASDYNQGKSIIMGSGGTTATGIASGSSDRSYCPPGDTTAACAPMAEWRFEEGINTTVNDMSGNGRVGTLTNGPTWIAGKVGKAVNLDGSNDYMSLTRFMYGSSGLTMSAWIKTTSTDSTKTYAGNAAQNVIGDTTTGVGVGFGLTGGKIQFCNYTSAWECVTGLTNANDGKWHQISATFATNGAVILYLDGRADNTGTITSYGTEGIDCVGRGYSSDYFAGQLDEVKVYNYARTPAEIAWDYNHGAPVGWWKMDETEGTNVNDSSGNNAAVATIGTSITAGKINNARNFGGTNADRIAIPDSVSLSPKQVTVAEWVNITSTTGGWQVLTWKSSNYELSLNNSLYFRFGITNASSSRVTCDITGTTILLGQWYHVAFTYDGSNITGYLNGKKIGNSCVQTGDIIDSSSNLTISDSTYPVNGKIDDVRVYNYALTPEQIEGIYNGGAVSFK